MRERRARKALRIAIPSTVQALGLRVMGISVLPDPCVAAESRLRPCAVARTGYIVAASPQGGSMAKEATARARMDAGLKKEAESILAECGLNATQGINLFYRQIVLHNGLPFDVRIPNAESRKAMREIETGEGLVRFGRAEDLFTDLRI